MTAATAPTPTSDAALLQLAIAVGLICVILAAAYLWAAVRTAAEQRHAAILTAYTEPLTVQPRGAQTGRHRAELIAHDTCPITTADIQRAVAAGRGATR